MVFSEDIVAQSMFEAVPSKLKVQFCLQLVRFQSSCLLFERVSFRLQLHSCPLCASQIEFLYAYVKVFALHFYWKIHARYEVPKPCNLFILVKVWFGDLKGTPKILLTMYTPMDQKKSIKIP